MGYALTRNDLMIAARLSSPRLKPDRDGGDHVDGIGDRYDHDDERHAGAGGAEHHASPARDPDGRADGEHQHGDDGRCTGHRAQEKDRQTDDDEEYDRRQGPQVTHGGLAEGAVERNVAGHVIVDAGMTRASVFQERVQELADLPHRQVVVLREHEVDHHPSRAPVIGDQPPDEIHGTHGDRLDAGEIEIAQRARILDQRRDDQIVLAERLAVAVVGERIDPAGIGRAPRGFGELGKGAERLAGEHRALTRCDGDQRAVARRVGVLEGLEREELGIVVPEQYEVVIRNRDEAGAGGGGEPEQRSARDDPPRVSQNGVYVTVQR